MESSTRQQWWWAGRRGRAGGFPETGALTPRSSGQQLPFSETTFPGRNYLSSPDPERASSPGALASGRQPIRKAFHVGPTEGNEKDVTRGVTQALCPGPPALRPRPGSLWRHAWVICGCGLCREAGPGNRHTPGKRGVPTRCRSFLPGETGCGHPPHPYAATYCPLCGLS